MRTIGRARRARQRNLAGLLAVALVLGALSGAGLPRAAHADGAWLDDQSVTWNTAGMSVPGAVGKQGNVDPRCTQQARPAETDEDCVACDEPKCGKAIRLTWPTCPHCGHVYPDVPRTEPAPAAAPRMRTRAEVKAAQSAPRQGAPAPADNWSNTGGGFSDEDDGIPF